MKGAVLYMYSSLNCGINFLYLSPYAHVYLDMCMIKIRCIKGGYVQQRNAYITQSIDQNREPTPLTLLVTRL